jgi:hypothetical protein
MADKSPAEPDEFLVTLRWPGDTEGRDAVTDPTETRRPRPPTGRADVERRDDTGSSPGARPHSPEGPKE